MSVWTHSLFIIWLMSKLLNGIKVKQVQLSSLTTNFIPSLSSDKHKGQAGRIAVFVGLMFIRELHIMQFQHHFILVVI